MSHHQRPVTASHRLEAGLLAALEALSSACPTGLWVNLGALAGALAARLAPVRRADLRESLQIAFGDSIDPSERRRLEREAYKNLAMLSAETLALARRGRRWLDQRVTEAPGLPILKGLCDEGRAPICVTGHFGNWELMGAWAAQHVRAATLAKPLHNALVQQRVADTRQRLGLRVLWTDRPNLPRDILETIRGNWALNFLADQDMRHEGIFVDFFGRPASSTPAPALFALRTGRLLLPVFLVRLGPTRHRFEAGPPIDPATAVGETRDEKIHDLTQRLTRRIEDMARLHPAQYFWFHRRWKTTPRAAEKRRVTLQRRRNEALAPKPDEPPAP